MRFVFLLCGLITVAGGTTLAQHNSIPEDTLAEVGSAVLTARDFLERFELMPFLGKDQGTRHDSAKVQALRALVAEQLLSQEAAVRGVNRDSISVQRRNGLERMMVRDELFKREVAAKVTISDRELSAGMRRYPLELKLLFLASPTGTTARELRDSIARAAVPDSLIRFLSPRLLYTSDTVVVQFGSQDWTLEDTAYALTMKRRLSQPVKTDYLGWGVIYLLEQRSNMTATNKSIPDRISAVRSIIRQRKMDDRAAKYQGKLLSPQRAVVDSTVFEMLGTILHARISADSTARVTKMGFRLTLSDIDSVKTAFSGRLQDRFAEIPGGDMTIQDLLDALQSEPLAFPTLDRERFLNRLNSVFKDIVRRELISREAYRQNIQHTPAVRHDVGVWDNYWAAAALIQQIRDSVKVNEEQALAFLIQTAPILGKGYEVNVREVLCDSFRTALDVLRRIAGGDSLGAIARAQSRRPGWPKNNGESGFFAVDVYPSLGFPALFQESGTIGGPIQLKEGFSVFTTLAKRTPHEKTDLDLDTLKTMALRGARLVQQEKAIDSVISELAGRAGVRFHFDRLKRLEVTPANMFTRRYLGFGGVVTAVPSILPIWNWKAREEIDILP
jgi:hypothetical protein